MDIIKVGILGVAAVLMAIPLRKEKQEYSMFLSMAVCICIFICSQFLIAMCFLRNCMSFTRSCCTCTHH